MKKLLLLTSVAALTVLAVGCKKDEPTGTGTTNGGTAGVTVEKTQRGFIGYVGATWCPPCGSYGGPAFKEMMKKFTTDQTSFLYYAPSGETGSHIYNTTSGKIETAPFANDLYTALKSKGSIPFFNVNGVNVGGAYTDPVYTANTYGAFITSINGQTPKLGVGANKTLTANKLSCDVKVQLFEEMTGDLYYSVLAVENEVTGIQKLSDGSTNNSYLHKHVTRASLVGDGTPTGQKAFELMASGTTAANKEFTKTFSFDYATYDKGTAAVIPWVYTPANTEIIVSIWTKNGADWVYINSVVAK
jgi:hypothetical protein